MLGCVFKAIGRLSPRFINPRIENAIFYTAAASYGGVLKAVPIKMLEMYFVPLPTPRSYILR